MFLSDIYKNKNIFENISPIDLAEILFNSLQQKYPEAITRYGHEVIGDAIIDYAEEADDIHSMSDVDMAVDEILEYLENYQGDRTNDLEPDSSAPVTENLRKWFKEKWVRFGPDGKIRGACARGDSSEGKPKCLPQAKAHALGKKGRKYAAAKKRREDPNPERRGPAKNVATKKKSNEGMVEAVTLDRSKNPNYPHDPKTQKHHLNTAKALLSDPKTDPDSRREAAAIVARLEKSGVAEGMPSSVIKHKQKYAEMPAQEFAKVHKNTSDEQLMAMAWRHGYGKGSKHYINKKHKGQQDVTEGMGNIGSAIKALYQKIYNAGDDEIEYFYYDSPIFAQYWDEYEGDLDSIIAEVNPKELQIIHDELESYVQQARLAEGESFNDMWKQNTKKKKPSTPAHGSFADMEKQNKQHQKTQAKKKQQGVAESIHSPGATQYSGKPDAYTFSKVQQKNYDMLSSILARNSMKFTHIDARTYPARRSYLAPNRNDPKPFFLTSFIVKSPALEWIKYEGGTAGGGQNLVKINGKKMKLTEFLSLSPKQQDALLQGQQGVAEGQQICPECGGPAFSNLILAEKQDACYHKVKSRYKVWPSAYASGALVQCRKKGAANWGNKKKTNEAKESPTQDYQKMMNFVQGQRLSGVPPEQQVAVALFKELEKTKAYNKQLDAELKAAGERADIGAEQGEITSKELTKHRGELEKEKVKQQASKKQLQTLTQQLDQLKAAPNIDPEATAALERQIADLEQRMQSKQGTGVSAEKIAELEKAIAAVQQGETVDAEAIKKLEQQFKDAEEAAKTAQARVGQVKDYAAQIEKLNSEIDNLNSALANTVKPKLDQLDQENEHVYQELEQHDSLINQVVNAVTAPNPNDRNIATMTKQMVQQNPQQAAVQSQQTQSLQQAAQGVLETRFYFTPKATATTSLRNDFNMTQDREGWYITESQGPAAVLEAQRAFGIPKIKQVKLKEVRISDLTGRAGTIGDENATSPIGSLPRKGRKYA